MNEILKKTASEQSKALRSKEVSAVELVTAAFERISQVDDKLGAFNSLTRDAALETARKVDEKLARGEDLPLLAGVPTALKDNMLMVGSRTTASSKMLETFDSPLNAAVVDRLNANLIPIVGKANMDEFAMGGSNESSVTKKAHNPWDTKRVPGGSSGGSAAAVAACEVPLALGSDTGGSIRVPASFCGVVGVKPTYGRVSRYGVIALASSLDQVGTLARTVEDAANLLEVISGHDAKDSMSINQPTENYAAALNNDIKGLRVGVVKELMTEGVAPDVAKAMQAAVEVYKSLGAEIVEVSLPHVKHSLAIYNIIMTAEVSSNLARFDGVRFGYRTPNAQTLKELYQKSRGEAFGVEVKSRIMLGTYVLSAGCYDKYYKKAQQVRTLLVRDFAEAFKKADILITPATANVAFEIGKKGESTELTDIATVCANMAGLPAMSVPMGFDAAGMPIGLQILAPQMQDARMFNAAHKFERANDFYLQLATI